MDIRLALLVLALVYFLVISVTFSAPVDPKAAVVEPSAGDEAKIKSEIDDLGLEYGRYLQQVVEALEKDSDFAKKLENVSQDEIKNGAIARELDFVSHSVRNQLDELKRIEMDRLRALTKKEHDLEVNGGGGGEGRRWRTLGGEPPIDADHVDGGNPHSFEARDLQKLIVSATKDLEALDAKRREDFKQYEMEKELRFEDAVQNMTSQEREALERKRKDEKERHGKHARVHHPGSKQQLEEVWSEQDHMPREEFNPKVFFSMHDVNGDGFLDAQEVEAILTQEIRKMYSEGNKDDDPNEMREEFHRMREHVYKEADVNRDGLISKKEFLEFTQRMEFERDDGWKGLDETKVYSDDELKQYRAHRSQQQQQQQQQYGAYQQYVPQYFPEGYHYPPPEHFQQPNPQLHAQQQYFQQQQQQALHGQQYGQQMGHQMAPQQPYQGHPGGQQMAPQPVYSAHPAGQQQMAPQHGQQPPQQAYAQHAVPQHALPPQGHQQPVGQPQYQQPPSGGQPQQHQQQPPLQYQQPPHQMAPSGGQPANH